MGERVETFDFGKSCSGYPSNSKRIVLSIRVGSDSIISYSQVIKINLSKCDIFNRLAKQSWDQKKSQRASIILVSICIVTDFFCVFVY